MTSETMHAGGPPARNLAPEFEAEAIPQLGELLSATAQLLENRETAQDVVQDVYLLAWKNFERFEPGTNCRAVSSPNRTSQSSRPGFVMLSSVSIQTFPVVSVAVT